MTERDKGKRHRETSAANARERSAAVAEIGEIPPVANPKRRKACRLNLLKFLAEYFPESTGLGPFSEDHKRVIGRIQRCILKGGLFVNAIYRGAAKTTISENAAIWAAVYGHRQFIPVIGAGQDAADGNIESIKFEFETNDLLLADFPEVCFPVRDLEGKPQRCASQTHDGALTFIEWTAGKIVLPTIKGSAASGVVIVAKGVTSNLRGMKHKTAAGVQQRPDFCIIDDPQTDESASTTLQVRKRLNVIRKSILRLCGHRRKMAVVMNATVIQPGDVVDQLLDQSTNPAWQGERIPMVKTFANAHETHWLARYKELRTTYDKDTPGDQERADADATAFYVANRDAMDAGCEVSWAQCFEQDTEVSAVQHAYNILIDDPEVFASECQLAPLIADLADPNQLTARQIVEKVNGVPRGIVPFGSHALTCMIDVQKSLLYWTVCAWGDGFTGSIVDYGSWPDQRRPYFTLADARSTLQLAYPQRGLEAQLQAGLTDLADYLLDREWIREQDGAAMRVKRCLIDANWGESTDTIYSFCRSSKHAALLLPSHGRGFGATSTPMADYKRKRGEQLGHNWRLPSVVGKRAVRHVMFDSNYWKSFVQARLAVAPGDAGCLSLFQPPSAGTHSMLADHLVAEYGVEVSAKGRTVVEWKLRPDRPDNHFLDCVVGNAVAASMEGVRLPTSTSRARPASRPTPMKKATSAEPSNSYTPALMGLPVESAAPRPKKSTTL